MLRKITINKDILFRSIDAISHKMAEVGMADKPDEVKDGASSDQGEKFDSILLNEYASMRDAKLRDLLSFCLVDQPVYELSNDTEAEAEFVYVFKVRHDYTSNMLRTTRDLISEYLKKGTLMDWYRFIGSDAASIYAEDVAFLEQRVMESLRPSLSANWVKTRRRWLVEHLGGADNGKTKGRRKG